MTSTPTTKPKTRKPAAKKKTPKKAAAKPATAKTFKPTTSLMTAVGQVVQVKGPGLPDEWLTAKVLHVDVNLLTVALKVKGHGEFILPIQSVAVKTR